jgi:hypothetical protein
MRAISVLIGTLIAFLIVTTAESAMPFRCQPGEGGLCACAGASDCQDMRKSGMCGGPLTCQTQGGRLVCNCTAAKTGHGTVSQPPASAGAKQKQ